MALGVSLKSHLARRRIAEEVAAITVSTVDNCVAFCWVHSEVMRVARKVTDQFDPAKIDTVLRCQSTLLAGKGPQCCDACEQNFDVHDSCPNDHP